MTTNDKPLREHQYKVLHCWYRISKLFLDVLTVCWRFGGSGATFCHVWWDCSKVKVYRASLSQEVEMIIGQQIPFIFRTHLLHDFSDLKLSRPRNMLLLNLCLAASLLVAARWKSEDVPNKKDQLGKVRFYFPDV